MKLQISELDLYRKGYVSIYVTATHACNLRCAYCYDKKTCGKAMDIENIERIISEVESLELPKYFYDISGGEFMLLDEWSIMLERFLRTGKDVSVNTNGTKIDTSNIKRIVELNEKYPGKLFLSVSLDSSNPELNQRTRSGVESNRVFSALELLTKNHIRYRVAITLTSVNQNDILSTIKDVVAKYSKEVIIGILRPTFDQDKYGHLMVSKKEVVKTLKEVEELKAEIGDFEFYHCLNENWDTFCEAGCDRICILPSGGVTACYTLQQDSDVVGNIYEEPLTEILQRMHDQNLGRDKNCLLCEHREACFGKPVYYLGAP